MLGIARHRLPGVPLHLADMRDFDLPERFDAVTCLFSSIGYLTTDDQHSGRGGLRTEVHADWSPGRDRVIAARTG